MQQQICALSHQPTYVRDRMVFVFNGQQSFLRRSAFLARAAPMLLRLMLPKQNGKPTRLREVPGIDGTIPMVGPHVTAFNLDHFLNIVVRPRDDIGLRRWSRQVVAGFSMFGVEVRDYAATTLGIDPSSITKDEQVMAQTGCELVEVQVELRRVCASKLDPNADRFNPQNPFRMKHHPRRR